MVVTPLFGIDSIIYCNALFVECCRRISWKNLREYVDFEGKGFYNIIIRTQRRITTNYVYKSSKGKLFMDKEQLIELMSEKILNEEASLFVAAGLSQSAGYCSWKELLTPCAQKLNVEINDDTDLYLLAQYFVNTYGESDLIKIIEQKTNKISYESDLIASLLQLDIKNIWTTNFDKSLEQILLRRGIITRTISHEKDLASITNTQTNIFKLNGDISNLNEMIVTKSDYINYIDNHEMFLTFLKRELATKTFLFIGYSFKDSLILDCLDKITKCFMGSSPYHYTILKNDSSPYFKYFVDDLEKRYRIKTLIVNDFNEIPLILHEIAQKVKNKKIFISGSFDWLPINEDVYVDDLCKNLAETLIGNNYRICTGLGRKLGNYISGHAYQYCLTHHIYNMEKYLIMRPFHERMEKDKKTNHRISMINECNIAIFAYGKSPSPDDKVINSQGVIEEYQIAKNQNKFIIPLGMTGFSSKIIFDDIKNNIVKYQCTRK